MTGNRTGRFGEPHHANPQLIEEYKVDEVTQQSNPATSPQNHTGVHKPTYHNRL